MEVTKEKKLPDVPRQTSIYGKAAMKVWGELNAMQRAGRKYAKSLENKINLILFGLVQDFWRIRS